MKNEFKLLDKQSTESGQQLQYFFLYVYAWIHSVYCAFATVTPIALGLVIEAKLSFHVNEEFITLVPLSQSCATTSIFSLHTTPAKITNHTYKVFKQW